MKDCTEGKLDESLAFAKERKDDSLQKCIDRLKQVEKNYNEPPLCENDRLIDTNLFTDFAPHSFYFVRVDKETQKMISNGGIIFHGKHDNGGDGSAPTFSVSLTPCNGWQIHT